MRRSPISIAVLLLAASAAVAMGLGCGDDDPAPTTPNPTRELNSGSFDAPLTFAHQFNAANAFPYHCAIHNGMTGSVTVSDAAAPGDTAVLVTISDFSFSPSVVTVRTGGNVYWLNSGNSSHTVTSD